ncbi:hypothetical protein TNCV_5128531 [Trichonephila clavipes]|nr:hypothetical protein TNCV_5128531 [Trichonephila clavipes]
MFSLGNISEDHTGQGNYRIPCVLRKDRTQCANMVLSYLVVRGRLEVFDDRAQTLELRGQKCSDLRSNYRRSELEMCVLFTQ